MILLCNSICAMHGQKQLFRVIDTQSKEGLADCIIYTGGLLSLSNDDGQFQMDFKDSVVIQHLGYRTAVFYTDEKTYELTRLAFDLDEVVITARSNEDILFDAIESLRRSMDVFLEEDNTFKYELSDNDFDLIALIALDPSFKLGEFEVYNAAFKWKDNELDTMKIRPLTQLTYSLKIWPSLNLKSKFYTRKHAERKYKIQDVKINGEDGLLIYHVQYKKYYVKIEINEYLRIVDIQTYKDEKYTELWTHLSFEHEVPTSLMAWGHAEIKWHYKLTPIPNLSFIQSSNKYLGVSKLEDLQFGRLQLVNFNEN